MTDRDAMRERGKRQANCQKCGSQSVNKIDGAKLNPFTHFAGVVYKVCAGCGFEIATRARPKAKGRP